MSDLLGRNSQGLDVVEQPGAMVFFFVDVLPEVRRDDFSDGITGQSEGLVAGDAHQGDAALHDAMELDEKRREQMLEIAVRPEEVTGCVESILREADLGPKDVAVR